MARIGVAIRVAFALRGPWLGLPERVASAHATPWEALERRWPGSYSSARMMVSTRVVTAGSAGSGEPISVARS